MASMMAPATAQQSSGGIFTITRHSIDQGGGVSSGGIFALTGSIAQIDADPSAALNGNVTLRGGFWLTGEAAALPEAFFRDGFE